jgi:Uma2 family endonuclease
MRMKDPAELTPSPSEQNLLYQTATRFPKWRPGFPRPASRRAYRLGVPSDILYKRTRLLTGPSNSGEHRASRRKASTMGKTGAFRWTKSSFLKAASTGFFGDVKSEFLGGRVFLISPAREHSRCTFNLERLLKRVFAAERWAVAREYALDLAEGLPLPDLAVLRFPEAELYSKARGLPTATDVALLIEVSDHTYRHDRLRKLPLYAAVGIPCYWIVRVRKRRVEVFWDPEGRGDTARYLQSTVYKEGQDVPIVVDGAAAGYVAVADILEEV